MDEAVKKIHAHTNHPHHIKVSKTASPAAVSCVVGSLNRHRPPPSGRLLLCFAMSCRPSLKVGEEKAPHAAVRGVACRITSAWVGGWGGGGDS